MATDFDRIEEDALGALAAAADSAALEKWRIAFLGRSAPVMAALGTLGALPKEERKAFGQRGNQAKQALERAFEEAGERIRQAELASALAGGRHRRHGAGPAARARAAAPGHADAAPDLRDLRGDGLPGLPVARRRNRRDTTSGC